MWLFGLLACLGGGMRHEVALADLAPLGAPTLAALKDEEHALLVAVTMMEGAQAEADRADLRVDEARALVEQARLELDTNEAALEAARASRDPLRIGSAEGYEESAREALAAAKARLDWQEAAQRVADDAIDLAEARIALRDAELELARYDLLASANRAVKYRRSDFVDQVDSARASYEEAEQDHERIIGDATRAWEEWRRFEQYPGAWRPQG